jgi:hypothetical protein
MPAFITPSLIGCGCDSSRRTRKSGQRLLVSGVERVPSVIESPKVTSPPIASDAATSTR